MKPTNEQIEQYRKIVADAPEGATHFSSCTKTYMRYSKLLGWNLNLQNDGVYRTREIDQFNSIHCLDDLRAIIALHDENEALKQRAEKAECIVKSMYSLSLKVASGLHSLRGALDYLDENAPESINEKIRIQAICLSDGIKQLRAQLKEGE